MEHPIFTLSTKPDTTIRRNDAPNGKAYVQVTLRVLGRATIHDRDVLIYCISQIMAALNAERGYEQLKAAFERLLGTRIETNLTTNNVEQIDMFGLIDRVHIVRETSEGRMQDVEVTLSDWVFNAIAGNEVLTLNRRYFQLRKPLERRLYEIARKQCGKQREWQCGLEKLQIRVGSTSSPKEFKRMVKAICEADDKHDHMPDYAFRLIADILHVTPKIEFIEAYVNHAGKTLLRVNISPLSPDTIEQGRELCPTWDINVIIGEWRAYSAKAKEPPKNADVAFLGFCKAWFKKRGRNGY